MDDSLPLASVLMALALSRFNKSKPRTPEELERLRVREQELEEQRTILQAEKDKVDREEMERAPRAYRLRQAKANRSKGSGAKVNE